VVLLFAGSTGGQFCLERYRAALVPVNRTQSAACPLLALGPAVAFGGFGVGFRLWRLSGMHRANEKNPREKYNEKMATPKSSRENCVSLIEALAHAVDHLIEALGQIGLLRYLARESVRSSVEEPPGSLLTPIMRRLLVGL
jgi:hypothetical protein